MNLEKTAKRAKALTILIGCLGVLVLIFGVATLIVSISQIQGAGIAARLSGSIPELMIAGFGLLVVCAVVLLYPLIEIRARSLSDEGWRYEQIRGSLETMRQLLETIRDSTSLSDAAKQTAYRHKDREALRHAIREDIEKNDYEAAHWLVSEMERRFGNRQEASQFREMIETSRQQFIDRELHESLEHFSRLVEKYAWTDCQREIEHLTRIFPGNPEIMALPERVASAKAVHKRDLLKEWKDAVARDDVDRSVELLKQLDQYLTPAEGEEYKEVAREVFRKKLQQLGVQFELHWKDKNWSEALRIGLQITDEYPNARIAAEVRERLAVLKERAGQSSVAI